MTTFRPTWTYAVDITTLNIALHQVKNTKSKPEIFSHLPGTNRHLWRGCCWHWPRMIQMDYDIQNLQRFKRHKLLTKTGARPIRNSKISQFLQPSQCGLGMAPRACDQSSRRSCRESLLNLMHGSRSNELTKWGPGLELNMKTYAGGGESPLAHVPAGVGARDRATAAKWSLQWKRDKYWWVHAADISRDLERMEEDDWGYMGGVGGDSCRLGGRWRRRIRDCPSRDNAISEVFFGDDTATEHGGASRGRRRGF
jgi:hypothetical protein